LKRGEEEEEERRREEEERRRGEEKREHFWREIVKRVGWDRDEGGNRVVERVGEWGRWGGEREREGEDEVERGRRVGEEGRDGKRVCCHGINTISLCKNIHTVLHIFCK
jgi:hypothetical protein